MFGLKSTVAFGALGSLLVFVVDGSVPADTRWVTDPGARSAENVGVSATDHRLSVIDENTVIQEYCVRCHSDRRLRGNLSLESFDMEQPHLQGEVAEKMVVKLRAGMMPPAGVRRPPEDSLTFLASSLEERLDEVTRENPNPGRRTFQRLNRAEYEASILDLFQIHIDASAYLPTETISDNFDNIADTQILSATLLESYMRAAAQVSRDAVGDVNASPSTTVYKVPKTTSQVGHVEGAPLGTRGGIAITHNFPADGDYVFELDMHPSPDGQLFGLTSGVHHIEVAVDGVRVALLELDRWMSEGDPTGLRVETPAIHVRAGPHHVTAAFILEREGPITDLITPIDFTLADPNMGVGYGVTTLPHLRDFSVSGPFTITGVSDTPARRRIFSCRPTAPDEEEPCAREIIRSIAVQAFRRAVENDEVEDLMFFFEEGREEGGFEIGIRNSIWAILSSPRFIFRLERTPDRIEAGELYELDDRDLASRLAFFLWAAPPDEELVHLARDGRLSDEDELRRQTRRMLTDPRAESLATRFASQWLRLQDLQKINPDAQLYPYFNQQLKTAMDRERVFPKAAVTSFSKASICSRLASVGGVSPRPMLLGRPGSVPNTGVSRPWSPSSTAATCSASRGRSAGCFFRSWSMTTSSGVGIVSPRNSQGSGTAPST